jgi:hypothetical protein
MPTGFGDALPACALARHSTGSSAARRDGDTGGDAAVTARGEFLGSGSARVAAGAPADDDGRGDDNDDEGAVFTGKVRAAAPAATGCSAITRAAGARARDSDGEERW